jgi:hypothetical protein
VTTTLTKEQAAKEEAEILALEQFARVRWCRLKGHRWELPQPNPLNADFYTCPLQCNRCGVMATLTITLDAVLDSSNPAGALPKRDK